MIGLTEGQASFSILKVKDTFVFRYTIYMHKDNVGMLNNIAKRLTVGKVNEWDNFAAFVVSRKEDLVIKEIFEEYTLNTTKNK